MMQGFRVLAALRGLRGTRARHVRLHAPSGATERALIGEYEALCRELIAGLTPDNHALGDRAGALPEKIRGYGHVKARNLADGAQEWARLLAMWRAPPARRQAAE